MIYTPRSGWSIIGSKRIASRVNPGEMPRRPYGILRLSEQPPRSHCSAALSPPQRGLPGALTLTMSAMADEAARISASQMAAASGATVA
jgi:hypothetical protein